MSKPKPSALHRESIGDDLFEGWSKIGTNMRESVTPYAMTNGIYSLLFWYNNVPAVNLDVF